MEKVDNKNGAIVETFDDIGEPAYNALYRRIKKRIDRLVDTLPSQIKKWATGTFVKSVNGKSGSEISIDKGDIGLGNVDNTADANKSVSHAATADNADTLDSKHAVDFLLKSEHDAYASEVAALITAIDAKKVDKVEGKGLSTNDFTTEDKNSLKAVIADMENVIAEKDALIQDMEQAVILERKGYSSIPLLCGQPMILFGSGTPQESIVPTNWKQFDPITGEGYNWNGTPSAEGQTYINTTADTNGHYTAIKSGYNLIWKPF